ncbi:MAG: sugar-specific transcriptional regulator, TrmB family [Microbacterium sp.]|jgi:DNA-binding MarR family transcriptional regulator|nr:sugar-specific transcriptional regulator, TrmB family [Microbacterium sp.]
MTGDPIVDPTVDELLRGMRDLRIAFEAVSERVARAAGLNPRDLGILDVLHAEGPSSPKQIAARTGIHPATLTAALARLERDGHVERRPDPRDGRSVTIAISPNTVHMLSESYQPVNTQLQRWLCGMSLDERIRAENFLRDATNVVSDPAPPTSAREPLGDPSTYMTGPESVRET